MSNIDLVNIRTFDLNFRALHALLEPAAIIELVVCLSVLQTLHRLGAYYRA